MAAKLADAIVALSADVEGLRNDLSKAKSATSEGADAMEQRTSTMGNVMQGVYHAIGGAIVNFAQQAIGQATTYMSESISMASDLNETTSKIGVLFGDASKSVLDWSKNAATSLGQSQQQALDAAATFATFGKAAGLSGDDLSKFSTDFVGLASDLASFNNTTPEQAINAIGAALRGESEPLRAYGVLLDDASMRQKALELGLISTTKEALTPQQKVLAAQALIYEQTSAAQGDFARTSGGLANQQRILDAQMTNLQTTIGTALLPVWLTLVGAMNDLATSVIPPLADFVTNTLTPAFTVVGMTIQALYDILRGNEPLGDWANLWESIAEIMGPEMADRIYDIMTTIDDLRIKLAEWASNFTQSSVFQRIQESITGLGGELAPLGEKFTKLWEVIEPVVTALGEVIGAVLGVVAVAAINYFASLFEHLPEQIGAVVDIITALMSGDLAGVFNGLRDLIVNSFAFWYEFVTNTLSDLGVDVDAWMATFTQAWRTGWNGVYMAYHNVENYLVAGWKTVQIWVTETLPSAFQSLWMSALQTWQSIQDAILDKISPITDTLDSLRGWLEDTVAGAFQSLRDVVNGLTFSNPFSGMLGWLDDLREDVGWLIDHIPLIGDGGGGGRSRGRIGTRGVDGRVRSSAQMPALALRGLGGSGEASIAVNVYATKVASEVDEYRLAYRIADVIRRSR